MGSTILEKTTTQMRVQPVSATCTNYSGNSNLKIYKIPFYAPFTYSKNVSDGVAIYFYPVDDSICFLSIDFETWPGKYISYYGNFGFSTPCYPNRELDENNQARYFINTTVFSNINGGGQAGKGMNGILYGWIYSNVPGVARYAIMTVSASDATISYGATIKCPDFVEMPNRWLELKTTTITDETSAIQYYMGGMPIYAGDNLNENVYFNS